MFNLRQFLCGKTKPVNPDPPEQIEDTLQFRAVPYGSYWHLEERKGPGRPWRFVAGTLKDTRAQASAMADEIRSAWNTIL